MPRSALSQRNPNRLAVQGLDINASIASVELLKALYTLKRAGWVRTPHGWQEGTEDEKFVFWKAEELEEPSEALTENHIMKRKAISKMDSLIAEAQLHRSGRWERTPMGGWRRIVLEEKENQRSGQDGTDNEDTLVEASADDSLLAYKGTKRSFDEYEKHCRPQLQATRPSQKKKKSAEPKRIRPQPNVNMDDYDVSSIHLEDEESEEVPVFDTCDDVRSKIAEHMSSSQMTRAAFMRLMCSAAFPTSKKSVQDRQLANFQSQKGAKRGCESNVYYAAYVYLEKLRLKRDQPKSEKREEMEQIWGDEGIPRKIDRNTYILTKGDVVYENEYGVRMNTVGGFARDESIEEMAYRNSMLMAMDSKK